MKKRKHKHNNTPDNMLDNSTLDDLNIIYKV
jgi:hypothetical protein